MKLTKTFESKIDQFQAALNATADGLVTAGKLLVEMIEENENTFEIILTRIKTASLPFLEALERVGRGQLRPELLLNPAPAAQRTVQFALPIKVQDKIATGYLETVVKDGDGFLIKHKKMDELTAHESARVIGTDGIRTVEQQKAIIKEQIENRAAREMRFEIRNDRVVFHTEHAWTWSELEEIADKIKPKAVDIEKEIKKNQVR